MFSIAGKGKKAIDREKRSGYSKCGKFNDWGDFTGYGCVNCRKMEAFVLANDSVKARLQNYVFIELFVDDKRDGVGDRNSQIQREQLGGCPALFSVQG